MRNVNPINHSHCPSLGQVWSCCPDSPLYGHTNRSSLSPLPSPSSSPSSSSSYPSPFTNHHDHHMSLCVFRWEKDAFMNSCKKKTWTFDSPKGNTFEGKKKAIVLYKLCSKLKCGLFSLKRESKGSNFVAQMSTNQFQFQLKTIVTLPWLSRLKILVMELHQGGKWLCIWPKQNYPTLNSNVISSSLIYSSVLMQSNSWSLYFRRLEPRIPNLLHQ